MSSHSGIADIFNMMGRLAHEINNRLSMISLTVENALLENESVSGISDENLMQIKNQSYIMSHIVEAMQILTSVPTQKPKPVDLNHLITRSIAMAQFMQSQCSTHFSTNLMEFNPTVLVDKIYMEKCLISLFENALNMLPQEGEIVVKTKQKCKGSRVQISVVAHSESFISENDAISFDSTFSFKNDDSISMNLNLALTQKIINLYNGEIQVQRHKGVGTIYNITLPVHNQNQKTNTSDYLGEINPLDEGMIFTSQTGGIC